MGNSKKKKKRSAIKRSHSPGKPRRLPRSAHHTQEMLYIKKHVDKLWEFFNEAAKRLRDLEVHTDLMQRLLVNLALQKLNMRLSELRKLIRHVEREAIADSEVYQIKEIFELPAKEPSRPYLRRKPKQH